MGKIMDMTTIRLSDCVPFADNPFRVQDDTAMEMLTESIKESGILIPIVVRPMRTSHAVRRMNFERFIGLSIR